MSTFEEIDTNIQRWMSEESGWKFFKVADSNYRGGYSLTIKNNNQIGVIIEKIDRITIQKTFSLPSDIKTSYSLSPHKYNFVQELKVYLMLLDVVLELTPSIEKLEKIDVAIVIYFDGFSRDKFIHSILKIADAIEMCIILWKKFESLNDPRNRF